MDSEQVANNWRVGVYRLAWLRLGVQLSVAYCLAWGLVSLVARGLIETSTPWLWWGGTGLAIVWIVAGVLAKRQVPSIQTTLAMLDRENQLGGLLMADAVGGQEAWGQGLANVRSPRISWRGLPSSGALGLSALFVLAALLVPMPTPTQASSDLDVSRSMAAMQQQVEVLEEEQILEAPEAEQIREAMERIKQEATGDDPSKTWEALDHLAQQIDQAADQASDLAQQRMEEAAGVEALSKALQEGAENMGAERLGEAMAALEELTDAAAGEPTLDSDALDPDLAEAIAQAAEAGTELTPEMLEQLAEAMAARQAELREMLEALEEAGLAEGEGMGEGGEAFAEIDPAELLEWLEGEGAGECDGQALLAVCRSLKAGRGGISDGPGHAEMIWQDPSSSEGVEFAPELLPPSKLRDLRDSQKLGTSRGTPEEIEGAQGSTGGSLSETESSGGSAAESVVLPRHRGAVQRYFDRDSEE